MPFDIAFGLPDRWRSAWVIAMGTLNGRRFDWNRRRWKDPEEA